jgi:NAD(P)-dependent dehydrogenase (short-subunit alcohol dehydrogenase family)
VRALELENKIVVVAGGASGIGTAIAQLAAAEGATVIVADRNLEEARRVASTLPNGDACALDVIEQSSIDALVSFVETRYGAPDVLFNSAETFNVDGGNVLS